MINDQPGKKPGTSSRVMSGMLKASQKRTNRAPFTEALMSKQPAIATLPHISFITTQDS